MRSFKVVVVGDGAVGKTCLLISYTSNTFPSDYIPTVFDNYTKSTLFEGEHYKLELWDTAGQEDYDRLRPLSYPQTDIFLVCFSIVEPSSFTNVKVKWIPEIRHHSRDNIKILLIGTKSDLRDDPHTLDRLEESGNEPVSKEEARKLVRDLGLYEYVECSAALQTGVEVVFEKAIVSVVSAERELLKAQQLEANGQQYVQQQQSQQQQSQQQQQQQQQQQRLQSTVDNSARVVSAVPRKIRKKSKCVVL
ncbi:hypothetical protein WICPIJ_003290 [Wickerhamomyces pijperi]|uniref:Uncharacterized protein n=1 Tax=Wickerhamomyces pijperi TaxID=599730 RepID=A0A9P8TNU9_WICPI|nr:hypothetical protein WICPIJ_003290 [Wickerhamomyces pijperi]